MIRFDDEHVSVRISDLGLRQAYVKSEFLRIEDAKRVDKLLAGVAVAAMFLLGSAMGLSSVFGD